MSVLSDELLMAYVDGQLDTAQAQLVAGRVQGDPGLIARVRQFQGTQARLVEAFGAVLREGPRGLADRSPRPVGARIDVPSARHEGGLRHWLLLIALAGGVAAIGYGATRMFVGEEPAAQVSASVAAGWAADILRQPPQPDASAAALDAEAAGAQLSRMAGGAAAVPDWSAQGYAFRRGGTVALGTVKGLRLTYGRLKGRATIELYIVPGGPEQGVTAVVAGDTLAATWARGGLRFLVTGREPADVLTALAEIATARLARD